MKITIVASIGVPNRYGGLKRLAERLGYGLGHGVEIYCPYY